MAATWGMPLGNFSGSQVMEVLGSRCMSIHASSRLMYLIQQRRKRTELVAHAHAMAGQGGNALLPETSP